MELHVLAHALLFRVFDVAVVCVLELFFYLIWTRVCFRCRMFDVALDLRASCFHLLGVVCDC